MNWRFDGDGAVQRYILPHGLLQGMDASMGMLIL